MIFGHALGGLIALSLISGAAQAQAVNQRRSSEPRSLDESSAFTLQVAAFAEGAGADRFVSHLIQAGETPVWGTVDLADRGRWVRVFIGLFITSAEARRHGKELAMRGVISQFMVKPAAEIRTLTRPRTLPQRQGHSGYQASPAASVTFVNPEPSRRGDKAIRVVSRRANTYASGAEAADLSELPAIRGLAFHTCVSTDLSNPPRPDPVQIAFLHLLDKPAGKQGGLWLSGDVAEGLERLQWIAGNADGHVIRVDAEGKVHIDYGLLTEPAGVEWNDDVAAPLLIAQRILSNEGLLLLVQLTRGSKRYRLHIGQNVRTGDGDVSVEGSINLDNNFDSRINPYRRNGRKLGRERPPEGFDSLIAINPAARWFNLRRMTLVPSGNIAFHELAEAYAKVEVGLEYLQRDERPGAHNTALEREFILTSQRPFGETVVTAGSNRVLKSDEEMRRFNAELRNRSTSDQ